MSTPPISVLTTRTALTERKISFIGPFHFPKMLGQKGKNNHKGE